MRRNDESMGDREEEADKSKDIHSGDHPSSVVHLIFSLVDMESEENSIVPEIDTPPEVQSRDFRSTFSGICGYVCLIA